MMNSVATATISEALSIGSPLKSMWRNLETPTGMRPTPTMNTTRPVTSAGNRKASRCTKRANTISTSPAKIVMPRISGMPPSQAAVIEAAKKFGPQRLGHRKPEPSPGSRRACRMVPMPQAIMVRATTARTSMKLPPISFTSTIGSTMLLDIRKMCCTASSASTPGGTLSSTP